MKHQSWRHKKFAWSPKNQNQERKRASTAVQDSIFDRFHREKRRNSADPFGELETNSIVYPIKLDAMTKNQLSLMQSDVKTLHQHSQALVTVVLVVAAIGMLLGIVIAWVNMQGRTLYFSRLCK